MPYFRHFGARDGLVHPNVMSICQDSLGRVWFGTENGVCVFDGRMSVVQGTGEFTQMLCDQAGTVWMKSGGDLLRYNAVHGKVEPVLTGKADAIYLYAGELHAVSGTEELRWNREVEKLEPFRLLPFGGIRHILSDRNGDTWYTCPQGLFQIPSSGQTGLFRQVSSIPDLTTVFASSTGEIWVGSTRSGLLRIQADGSLIRYNVAQHASAGFHSDNIRRVVEDADGNIWFGSFQGLYQYRPSTGRFVHYGREEREGGLSSASIHGLCVDRDGILWAGTYYGGVHFIDTRTNAVAFFPESPDGLSHPVVGHLSSGSQEVWICTEGGGINMLDTDRQEIERFPGQPFTNVKWVEPYPEKHCLYIGTNLQGLYRMDLTSKRIFKENLPGLSGAASTVNVVLRHGNELFLSTDDGVFVYSLESRKDSLIYPRTGNVRYVHGILYGDELWLASAFVVHIDANTKQIKAEYHLQEGNQPIRPMRLLTTDKGELYASTFGHGLYKFDGKGFVPFPGEEPLLNANGYQLTKAPHGQILVSGEKGIQLLDSTGVQIRSWLPGRNLPLDALVMDSGLLLTEDGIVYAGGTNGLVSFRLDSGMGSNPEDLYFSGLFVDGVSQEMPESGKLVLKGQQSLIELAFSSKHNVSELNWANYQYRLQGHDKKWRDVTSQTLSAEKVPVGRYCFQLRQRNHPDVLCSFDIVVKPRWYASWWAFLLYLLLLSAVLWILYRMVNLRREASRIQEINETKLRFFTTVSHELRSPLTLIIAQIESIFRTFHLPPLVTHKMNKVMNQAEQMNQLVTELIDFRKFEQGLVTLHLSPTYVNTFVQDIFDKFKEIAAGKDLSLEMIPDKENPKAFIDTWQMQKVMMNLIFNAVKYTPSGGRIQLLVESDPEHICIHVKDTGVGIADNEKDRVFERFYQAQQNDSVTQGIPGSGIGLALAKDIVQKHHGRISLESAPGEGSDFTVSLPRSEEVFAGDESVSLEVEMPATRESGESRPVIVIAEDNPEMMAVLKELFDVQYSVLCAASGDEAWEMVKQVKPDIVLSDVMMPGMSGTDLCAAIKGDDRLRDIPVVILTALNQTEHQIGSLLKGADDYIAKPFNSRLLLTRCNNLVSSRKRSESSKETASELALKATSAQDKEFLDKLTAIIEENIGNPDLNNDMLADLMHMSRSRFYSRFRAITNETPNDYITSCRLRKAAAILQQEPNKSVAEISEELGFNTQNYFCRRFKARFGVSPTQYRKI